MLVNVLIKKPILGKSRTLLIKDVREVVFRDDVVLLRCAVGTDEEEVIYPISKILSISE